MPNHTLTATQAMAMHAAAVAIQPPTQAEGDSPPRPMPWRARLALARIIAALAPVVEASHAARLAVIGAASGGRGTVDDADPAFAQVMADLRAVGAETVDVDLPEIAANDLDGTDLSPAMVAALLPVMEG